MLFEFIDGIYISEQITSVTRDICVNIIMDCGFFNKKNYNDIDNITDMIEYELKRNNMFARTKMSLIDNCVNE